MVGDNDDKVGTTVGVMEGTFVFAVGDVVDGA